MPLEQLWATWRSNYVRGVNDSRTRVPEGEPDDGRSLFERIFQSGAPDSETLIVARGECCFAILNRFPYTAGHLMVLPNRAVANLEDLTEAEERELWAMVREAVVALKSGLRCDGVNVGLNLGSVAGGSQADHIHVHAVPRWEGDANFMSVAAETRVIPVALEDSWESIRQAWTH
ncbi:MAG: HIT domain-containing protein [Microthrixaceae bacterium]|nr:HIT domain-containing protein [Microthrixaceae bacterium]